MIVNLEEKVPFALIKKIKGYVQTIFTGISFSFIHKKIELDSVNLKRFFKLGYPKLKLDSVGNTKCVSCQLCQDICPTSAIEVQKSNMVNFPSSLTTGESPLHFFLDVAACIKCGQCQQVCYVDALDLTGNYKVDKIDLGEL